MIKTMNIRNVNYADFDEVWAIVRSLKHPSPKMKQVTSLSPDWNLFKTYLNLKESGKWNADSFHSIYQPQFMDQIAHDANSTSIRDFKNSRCSREKHCARLLLPR